MGVRYGRKFGRCASIAAAIALAGSLVGCATKGGADTAATERPLAPKTAEQCPPASALIPALDSDYGRRLIKKIQRRAFYPRAAEALGIVGIAQLCVEVDSDGMIKKALISTSSGSMLLDGAALFAVGRARADPPKAPSGVEGHDGQLWLSVPVKFQLPDAVQSASASPGTSLAATNCASDREWSLMTPDTPAMSSAQQSYLQKLSEAIEEKMVYPGDALRQGEESDIQADIVIKKDGQIVKANIIQSGGDPLFDGAVLIGLGLVALQNDVGPVPEAGSNQCFEFTVPIRYEIQ